MQNKPQAYQRNRSSETGHAALASACKHGSLGFQRPPSASSHLPQVRLRKALRFQITTDPSAQPLAHFLIPPRPPRSHPSISRRTSAPRIPSISPRTPSHPIAQTKQALRPPPATHLVHRDKMWRIDCMIRQEREMGGQPCEETGIMIRRSAGANPAVRLWRRPSWIKGGAPMWRFNWRTRVKRHDERRARRGCTDVMSI
ncbi:hypothetical protein K505DRAFT_327521, partial [Melanomma pulvis-pyrius CBS 109.77]